MARCDRRAVALFGALAAAALGCGAADEAVAPGALAAEPAARVIAIGDVHGDLAALREALSLARLIDAQDHWSGGRDVVVQVGDVLDRGDDERAILDWLVALGDEARAAGGELIRLNGNHETMAVEGDQTYTTEGACAGFADLEGLDLDRPELAALSPACRARGAAFLPGGPYAKLLAEAPITAIVEGSVFVHAGLFSAHLDYGLERIDAEVRAWMRGERAAEPGPVRPSTNSLVWTRSYGGDVEEPACVEIEEVLSRLGAARMIVGHTVQDGISSACDGRVVRIDTGMTEAYGGGVEVLEIVDGEARVLR
jgi:hypothetical protein